MNYLLDTNVVSELVSKQPNPRVLEWVDSIDPACLFLSVITIGEIQKGISRLDESPRRNDLEVWLKHDLLIRFVDHILELDAEIMLAWGRLTAYLEKSGTPMPAVDSLLAATASELGLTLVTRNTADFAAAGIRLLNPWEAE